MDGGSDFQSSGIQAVTFVNVSLGYPGEKGEIAVDSNAVSVFEAGEGSTRHDGYTSVFDKSMSDNDVCEGILGPEARVNPMAACVGDCATILMLVLGSRKTKKHIFNKRSLLPFVCNELFAAIADKQSSAIGSYETAVKLSAFEIQDEVITDLLRPTNRGLVVQATPEEGIHVVGLTSEVHGSEHSLSRAIEGACDNRATHTLPPGGSIDTSSCVWELEIIQDEEVAGGSVRSSRSKFVICEVPATDPLVLSPKEIRQLEGPSLHKSLMTFTDVSKKLTSPQLAAIAPYRASKLTHYLSEMLGGNAVVLCLAQVIPGESKISRRTLEVASDLAQSIHFPITGHDMTGVLRGLLTKYRSLILQLQDEIVNGAPIGDAPPELSERRLADLQTELAQAHILKNQTKEDYTRLYEMMTMLKEKYKTLAEQKANQSQDLIKAEEERLNVARALVELKLEHSALLESTENEKYDLSTSLLAAKSEIYELDAALVTSKSEAASAKEASFELERLLKQEQQELAASAAALQEVKAQLEKENLKNVELGAELLTLVNQKDELQKNLELLQQKLDTALIRITSLQSESSAKDKSVEEYRDINRSLEDEVQELKREQTDHEIEYKRLLAELDASKDELDKMTSDFMKERETIYESAREAAENEIKSAQMETEEIAGMLRKADKRQRDLERTIKRLNFDLEKTASDLAQSIKDADDVREKYRQRLEQMFAPPIADADALEKAKYGEVAEVPLPLEGADVGEGDAEDKEDDKAADGTAKSEAGDEKQASTPNEGEEGDGAAKVDATAEVEASAEAGSDSGDAPEVAEEKKSDKSNTSDKANKSDKSKEGEGDKEEDGLNTGGDKGDATGQNEGTHTDAAEEGEAKSGTGADVDSKEEDKHDSKSKARALEGAEDDAAADDDDAAAEIEKANSQSKDAADGTDGDVMPSITEDPGEGGGAEEDEKKSESGSHRSDAGGQTNRGEDGALLENLIGSYVEKEQVVVGKLHGEQRENLGMKRAFRTLFDRYQKLLDIMEEHDPANLPPAKDLVDEIELLEANGVHGRLEDDDELSEEMTRLKEAEAKLQEDQANTAKMIDSVKSRLTISEAKVVALNEENAMLRAENQAKSTVELFKELQEKLQKQLTEQQDEMLAAQLAAARKANKGGNNDGPTDFASLMREQQAAREEEERRKKERQDELDEKLGELEVKKNAEIEELNAKITKLEKDLEQANDLGDLMVDGNGGVPLAQYKMVRSKLLDAEKAKAQTDARVISLEDELKQYNQYMRDSAVMYRRQVATLKQHGRQYHSAIQELQVKFHETNDQLTKAKRELETLRGPDPADASGADSDTDGGAGSDSDSSAFGTPMASPRGSILGDAPLESVREDEEEEEEEGGGGRSRSSSDGNENLKPTEANAGKANVPGIDLSALKDPEETGKELEEGPHSERLSSSRKEAEEEARTLLKSAGENVDD